MLRKSPIKKQIIVKEFSNNYYNNKIKEGQVLNFDCSYWQKFQKKKKQTNWNPGLCFIPANIFLLPTYSTACTVSKPQS